MAAEHEEYYGEGEAGAGFGGPGGGDPDCEEEEIDAAYVEALAAESAERLAAAGALERPVSTEADMGEGMPVDGAGVESKAGEEGEGIARPDFAPLSAKDAMGGMVEYRKVRVPPNRMTPLREAWEEMCGYIVEHMKLLIRMNVKTKTVEIKTSEATEDAGAIQKAEDFVRAFMMGFDLADAVALLRLDDIFIDSFEVTDVKMLKGDHLSRAIGRIAGQAGKTKNAIENATRTRIVVADKRVHILGAYSNIQVARDTVCSLILGTPPGKVYNQLRHTAARLSQRY